jgi:hypothetical protein
MMVRPFLSGPFVLVLPQSLIDARAAFPVGIYQGLSRDGNVPAALHHFLLTRY